MVEEPLLAESLPLEVVEGDGRVVVLHVSRAVLDTAEYFPVALSGRWSGQGGPLRLRLPSGCSARAAEQLLLRLYMPQGMRFEWEAPSLGRVLELLQIADMLMLGPHIMQELRRLLRSVVCTPQHVAELQQHCARFEVPIWLAQLAGAPMPASGKEVAAALSQAQITELIQSVSATNDPVAVKALDRVLQRRARLSIEYAEDCAKLLAEMLEARVHMQEEETVRGRKYSMKEGGRAFLDAMVAFVETCPEHLVTVARAFFFPVAREQKLGSCAVAQYKDTARGLLSLVSGSELPALLSCIVEAGRFDALEAVAALSDALGRADDATQVESCRVLARLPKVPAAMSSWKLLRSVITSVVPRVCPEAQLELCDALCDLHEDLLYQLINEPLLRGACTGAQLKLCGALAQLDVRRVHSAASAAVLSCLCPDARRLLTALLVPQIQTLKPDVQRIVLAELEEAPGEVEPFEVARGAEGDGAASEVAASVAAASNSAHEPQPQPPPAAGLARLWRPAVEQLERRGLSSLGGSAALLSLVSSATLVALACRLGLRRLGPWRI
mmetsp:Transcript_27038/g.85021  ORF Transcript_27038/g.85021 Transcript_27038/m.85021 type:complete len:556 (-) Transcript_27038:18-1685(-)